MTDKKGDHHSSKEEPIKATYRTPQLYTYGAVRELTQVVGTMGMNDMGGGGINKTAV